MIRNSMNTYTTPSIADATQRALKQMKNACAIRQFNQLTQ